MERSRYSDPNGTVREGRPTQTLKECDVNGFLLGLALCLCWGAVAAENAECVPRDYGHGGTVCVCDETHCDTLGPVPPLAPNEFALYVSSRSGLRFHYAKGRLQTDYKKTAHGVAVEPTVRHQKIFGFGGAFTDAAALNIKSLGNRARKKLLASYFSPEGIEYNFGRVPIGGTDFSTRKYTLDDVPDDLSLEHFQLSKEDVDLKIPIILEAQRLSRRRFLLMGAAWTAPPWMKTNNDYICFGLLKSQYYGLWAKYHIRFLEEYEKHGLKFWAVTTGNEPTAGLLPYYSFNCMGWTPSSQGKWVAQHLGPRLRDSRFNGTLIIGIEDQRFTLPWWPKIMFGNKEARSFVAGIGLHWYWDNYFPPQLIDWTHSFFPEKFILSTEACFVKERGSPAVLLGSWKRGEKYAANIISNINHYVGGWIDWNLALDLKGGPNWVNNVVDAPVVVNSSSGEFYKQPMFYALGHFSKFVPENSVRIGVKNFNPGLDGVAFLTPENNVVLVLLNRNEKSMPVNVHGSPNGAAFFHMPEKSIATLIFRNAR